MTLEEKVNETPKEYNWVHYEIRDLLIELTAFVAIFVPIVLGLQHYSDKQKEKQGIKVVKNYSINYDLDKDRFGETIEITKFNSGKIRRDIYYNDGRHVKDYPPTEQDIYQPPNFCQTEANKKTN